MESKKIDAIKSIIAMADGLRKQAHKFDNEAQALCDHHKEDGELAVYMGFGVGNGEEECSICQIPACYIPEWLEKYPPRKGW
jgi:hypothetical protein